MIVVTIQYAGKTYNGIYREHDGYVSDIRTVFTRQQPWGGNRFGNSLRTTVQIERLVPYGALRDNIKYLLAEEARRQLKKD